MPATLAERGRDAAAAAAIALLLGIPMIGLTTVDQGGALRVQTRWPWLAVFVIAVFCGRWLLRYGLDRLRTRRTRARSDSTGTAARPAPGGRLPGALAWLTFGISLALPLVFSDNRYVIDTATTVLIYVMLGWGLNVVVGLAGLLDMGHAAFYAVGAYAYALLSTRFGWGFWEALPVAALIAAVFGLAVGWPSLRLRGDYLAIVTLGFGEIIRVVLLNGAEFSGGPNGISQIPRPSFFGLPFAPPGEAPTFAAFFGLEFSPMHRILFLYYVILMLALLTNALVLRLRRLPIGRAWEAMREDEIACRALGMNVTHIKLSAFALGAVLGGVAGVFFAARQGFISPESFTFNESAIILAIVVLGGMGSQFGVVLASLVLVLLPEIGRDFAEYRMLLFGAAMILIMIWRPGGILAQREPTLRLAAKDRRV
ncbi:MAG: high-affinity branched-chain amino acid ABC transporter permease LivM [Candidatus Accumulibacter sp.]|jgi:branched-chain amino acid transport system permease protein|nr:high-affinity branched-chain amino acid ABC transporter permease LivM [Accumulibacter sp.]